MVTDQALNNTLTELCAIAKAPMTPDQRVQRARALVAGDVSVQAVALATSRSDLTWNTEMARVHEVGLEMWLEAVEAVGLIESDSLRVLLDRLHAAESAADLLRTGYTPERGPSGELTWSR